MQSWISLVVCETRVGVCHIPVGGMKVSEIKHSFRPSWYLERKKIPCAGDSTLAGVNAGWHPVIEILCHTNGQHDVCIGVCCKNLLCEGSHPELRGDLVRSKGVP